MRVVKTECIRLQNCHFADDIFLTKELICQSINHCYNTLDTIDRNLISNGSPRLSNLVELANLSSIVGNLLGEGLARYSNGHYVRNKPHTYPDLLSSDDELPGIELKVALEKNKPKGHLPKSGYYITYRYVLTDESGSYTKGKENRGDTVTIWEVKFGYLTESDFNCSNTIGDSGKTAVISTTAQNDMKLLYFDNDCVPYRHTPLSPYSSYN